MSNSVKIRKKNRILHVEKGRLAGFLQQGYDQIDEQGNVVKLATGGRTVSLPEYNKVLEELQALKDSQSNSEELDKAHEENEELKKEITALKGKLTKAENAFEATKEPKK